MTYMVYDLIRLQYSTHKRDENSGYFQKVNFEFLDFHTIKISNLTFSEELVKKKERIFKLI